MELSLGQLVYRLYFDGQEVDTTASFGFDSFDTTGELNIGGFGSANLGFEGDMDGLTIYDRTLSAEEIRALYETNATLCEAETLGGNVPPRVDHRSGGTFPLLGFSGVREPTSIGASLFCGVLLAAP